MFRRKKWKYLILDEAHMIKNWKSQRWQTLLNFNSKRRLLITGEACSSSRQAGATTAAEDAAASGHTSNAPLSCTCSCKESFGLIQRLLASSAARAFSFLYEEAH